MIIVVLELLEPGECFLPAKLFFFSSSFSFLNNIPPIKYINKQANCGAGPDAAFK